MEGYFRMREIQEQEEIEKIRKALLGYCRTDTLGMVRLYEKLKEMA